MSEINAMIIELSRAIAHREVRKAGLRDYDKAWKILVKTTNDVYIRLLGEYGDGQEAA